MSGETTHRATRVGSRRVLADVVAQLGGQVVNIALGIVTTVVIVRALEATRYGEWATILAVIDLVAMVGNLGLETVAIRLATQEPEREGAWVGAATSLRMAIAVPMLAVFVAVLALVACDEQMLVAGLRPLAGLHRPRRSRPCGSSSASTSATTSPSPSRPSTASSGPAR